MLTLYALSLILVGFLVAVWYLLRELVSPPTPPRSPWRPIVCADPFCADANIRHYHIDGRS